MTAADVCQRVSVHEFWDWQRFVAAHPFPADLIDLHGARQSWMTASVNRAADAPAFRLDEFRVLRDEPSRPVAENTQPMLEADRMLLALRGTEHGG